ncbi:hypothetical protein [Gallaecimonas xiamenensis]|uniref:Uncharacterized protein n=1 Tax=Gallaecimonas xiamenensis 3-C-1 TaxID=745411 RepID=K2J211_9GAMM|nr:hypothetical protein [Gallaecimonas xiamenensis]EKE77016.1 hypothetical protein B3C1_02385 [Gallaecimonas xiamenensis 3-C-1]
MPRFATALTVAAVILIGAFLAGRLLAQLRPLWLIEGHWQGTYYQQVDKQQVRMDYRLHTQGKHILAKASFRDQQGQSLGNLDMDLLYLGKTPDTGRNLFSLENPPADAEYRVDYSLRLPYILMLDKDHYFVLQRMNQGFIGTVFHRTEPPPEEGQ